MAEENVKVAVRVRPFNKRERARNAKVIVDMNGPTTTLTDPDDPDAEPRKFAYDFSYWSHDGCKEDATGYIAADSKHPNGKKFADQKKVYSDLGSGVMKNIWDGYNSTLFAYGQTGSGKSWSVVGYGVNKGIVPLFCDMLFKDIDAKKGGDTQYEVQFSMLEIYMEEVRDLLSSKAKSRGGLRIREHSKRGFYADGLTVQPVDSYQEIEGRMEEGTMNRTVAATQMNATSSRAHTIVGITFVQKSKNAAGDETAKSAQVNLVDLAGSERAGNTGATGDRLKEGAAINQSLSALGNCIGALADKCAGKKIKVPFRDSALTKLLKNALGGNSKTIMIAAISPADINYEETLSTLRYADRAKQIKTKAVVNEDPTDKLIRELQEENDRLKKMMSSGGVALSPGGGGENDDDDETEGMTAAEKEAYRQELEEDYKEQLEQSAKEMEELKKAFEEKLKTARQSDGEAPQSFAETQKRRQKEPHIYNVNFDPQMSGKIIHFLTGAKMLVGNSRGEASDISLVGPSIQEQHAVLHCQDNKFQLETTGASARVLLNGEPVTQCEDLHHNDRLMFGTTQLFAFCNPKERDASKEKFPDVTFEMAQEEIAKNSGFDMATENKSRDDMLLQEDLVDMLPAVEEANSISQDLDKKKKFELVLVSPEARGELKGRTQIFVRVVDLETGLEWQWSREKFLNRKFIMQELFTRFEDGEDIKKIEASRDPFVEDADAEIHVGSVKVWLQSLAYNIETREQLEITDFRGNEVGLLSIELVPCSKKGKELTEKDDVYVESATQQIGKDVHFLVKVTNARGLPNRFTDVYAKYMVYLETEYTNTQHVKDTCNPDWNHKRQFDFTPATEQLMAYLSEGAVMVQIWGKQKPAKVKKSVNTKDALQKQSLAKGQSNLANLNFKTVDANKVKFAMDLAVTRKRAQKAEQKVHQFRELVRLAEEYQKPRLSTALIRELLHAPTPDAAEKCFKMVPKEKGADDDGEAPGGSSTCVLL